MKMTKRITLLGALMGLIMLVSIQPSTAADKQVSIGYQPTIDPWKVVIADKALEKATGYHVKWVEFKAGGEAARGLASGAVQIARIGSVGITAAVTSGVPAQLFWIMFGIGSNEKLVVRDGSGISKPADLAGKRLAVPLGSTSQLDLYYALKNWNVDAHILNMNPQAIVAAWTRGNIDGAFLWNPFLAKIEKTGSTMISSGKICEQVNICTFDGLIVNKGWANEHPDFMVKLIQTLNSVTAKYVNNPKAWTSDSSMVQKVASVTGADPQSVPKVLSGYEFPLMKEQISDKWLGGGAAHSLGVSAKFLKDLGVLPQPLPDYGVAVTTKWVKMAMEQEGK